MFMLAKIKRIAVGDLFARIKFSPFTNAQANFKSATLKTRIIASNICLDYLDMSADEKECCSSQENVGQHSPKKRPLVLLMPWLRAKNKYINQYKEVYMRRGFDVMTSKIFTYDYFYPDETGKICLKALETELSNYDSIVIHAFSMGVTVLGAILLELEARKKKGSSLEQLKRTSAFENRIKAVVLDSVVTAGHMSELPKLSSDLSRYYQLYIKSNQMFLKLHRRSAVYMLAADKATLNSGLRAPALVMASDGDLFNNVVLSEKIVNIWRKRGIDVKYQRWKNGPHVQLLKHNHTEYCRLIDELIERALVKKLDFKSITK